MVSDAELVDAACAGAVESLAVLVERHRAGMLAVAVGVLGPGTDAEDAVQDAVVVALTRIGNLRDAAAAGAWLRGIARNRSLQLARARRAIPTADVETRLGPSRLGVPEQAIDSLAVKEWLWPALDALSEPLRLAVVLRHFSAATSYPDIAAISGVPVGTIRSRLSEGRRQLVTALADLMSRADGTHVAAASARRRAVEDCYEGYNRGDAGAFVGLMTDDIETWAGVSGERGKALALAGLVADMDAGMRFQVLDVIAGREITVVEGRFENPPDAPAHCPEWTTQVYLHRGEQIRSIRLHFRADV